MAQAEDFKIAGVEWRLTSLPGGEAPGRAGFTIAADGPISGRGPCNSLLGSVVVDGASVSFASVAMTRRMCEPDKMRAERAFSAALRAATSFAIASEDGSLILSDAAGVEVARFSAR